MYICGAPKASICFRAALRHALHHVTEATCSGCTAIVHLNSPFDCPPLSTWLSSPKVDHQAQCNGRVRTSQSPCKEPSRSALLHQRILRQGQHPRALCIFVGVRAIVGMWRGARTWWTMNALEERNQKFAASTTSQGGSTNHLTRVRRGRSLIQTMVMQDRVASIATTSAMYTTGSARLTSPQTRTINSEVVVTTEMHTNRCRPIKERAKRRAS